MQGTYPGGFGEPFNWGGGWDGMGWLRCAITLFLNPKIILGTFSTITSWGPDHVYLAIFGGLVSINPTRWGPHLCENIRWGHITWGL